MTLHASFGSEIFAVSEQLALTFHFEFDWIKNKYKG